MKQAFYQLPKTFRQFTNCLIWQIDYLNWLFENDNRLIYYILCTVNNRHRYYKGENKGHPTNDLFQLQSVQSEKIEISSRVCRQGKQNPFSFLIFIFSSHFSDLFFSLKKNYIFTSSDLLEIYRLTRMERLKKSNYPLVNWLRWLW